MARLGRAQPFAPIIKTMIRYSAPPATTPVGRLILVGQAIAAARSYHRQVDVTMIRLTEMILDTTPPTLTDVVTVLKDLANALQPNTQYDWEVRRNMQKIVTHLKRLF